ncbi:O-antigen ligase family protein [Desulfocurvus vexinensis]|uniref:O-antigen ligase family protein n=1 Tax=Desulfocurvus vexinensis TaxID=399548 RepID=UPI000688021D|nr:O-antigen ligase family protein [Desulfocurvus vexinensis]
MAQDFIGPGGRGPSLVQLALPLLILLPLALAFGWFLPHLSPTRAMAFGGGLALLAVCLFSTRAALLIVVFSMLLGPEFNVGGLSAQGTLGRGVTLRINDFVLLVVGFGWLAKMAIDKRLGLFLRTPLNMPIALYTLVCVLSSALGTVMDRVVIKSTFFYVLKYFEYMFVYFMVVNHLRTRRDMELFLWALLATCVAASLVGIAQIPGGGRITAPFEGDQGEPNTFGGYLVFMVALASGLLANTASLRRRLGLGLVIVLALAPLLHTGSRGSYLGLVGAMGMLVLLTRRKALALGVAALGLFAVLLLAPDIARERVEFTFEQGKARADVEEVMGVKLDTSSSERIKSWKDVAVDVLEHPILGYGVTGYKFIDGQYFRVVIETGLVGLALFAFLLVRAWVVAQGVFSRARDELERGLCMGFLAGFAGLLVHALSANTFIIGRIMEPFWFVLGMVVMIPRLVDARGRRLWAAAPEPAPVSAPDAGPAPGPAPRG